MALVLILIVRQFSRQDRWSKQRLMIQKQRLDTAINNMGDTILILAFVVIVIGGIGSIRGAFLAALIIGLVDTLGRSFAVDILRLFMRP